MRKFKKTREGDGVVVDDINNLQREARKSIGHMNGLSAMMRKVQSTSSTYAELDTADNELLHEVN
jgi:hypothetical protein